MKFHFGDKTYWWNDGQPQSYHYLFILCTSCR